MSADMNYRFTQSQVFAGVGLTVVAIALIVGVFAFGMYPSFRDATGEPAPGHGRIVFQSDRDGDAEIYVMNADGSGVEQLTDNDSGDYHPSWSPDGDRILFSSDRGNDVETSYLYVMNADGSGVEQLTVEGCRNGAPEWSPDGGRVVFTSIGDVYVMNADGSGVEQLTGDPPETCAALFPADRDGVLGWYIRNADGSVELFTDLDSLFDRGGTSNWFPSWSPDGGRIVFQSDRSNELYRFDLYVMNADGSGVEQLTDGEYRDWFPSWSPDGSRIAFSSDRDGDDRFDLYVMNADGSGVVRLTENEYSDDDPSWSPDGGRIAFSSKHDGDEWDIYVMNADGSGVKQLTDNDSDDRSPSWSPRLE